MTINEIENLNTKKIVFSTLVTFIGIIYLYGYMYV